MCRESRGLVTVAAAFGLVQSILWIGASLVVDFIYLCVVPCFEYKDKTDFFKVTLIKLYFEGPRCIPDGSYLGKFNKDYRSINLFGREIILYVLLAYIILNVVYFILSIGLWLKRQKQRKRFFLLSWSVTTLILCAVDALLTFSLVLDSFTLMLYLSDTPFEKNLGSLPFIPLLLAFISSRFIVLWIWNFFIGFYLLFIGLCSRGPSERQPRTVVSVVTEAPKKKEEKPKEVSAEAEPPAENASVSVLRGNFTSAFDITSHPDYTDYKRTLEAVTRFPIDEKSSNEFHNRAWCYGPPSERSTYAKSHSHKEWEATNEGYLSDEQVAGEFDFDHNLKNFEAGQRKIKVSKPPVGKPVSIPVPPPLPNFGSCNC